MNYNNLYLHLGCLVNISNKWCVNTTRYSCNLVLKIRDSPIPLFSDRVQVQVQVLTFGYSTIPSTDTSTSLCQKTLVNSQLEGVSDTRQAEESRIRGEAPRPARGRLGKARGEGASWGRGQTCHRGGLSLVGPSRVVSPG